jgi:hypothetical protein
MTLAKEGITPPRSQWHSGWNCGCCPVQLPVLAVRYFGEYLVAQMTKGGCVAVTNVQTWSADPLLLGLNCFKHSVYEVVVVDVLFAKLTASVPTMYFDLMILQKALLSH